MRLTSELLYTRRLTRENIPNKQHRLWICICKEKIINPLKIHQCSRCLKELKCLLWHTKGTIFLYFVFCSHHFYKVYGLKLTVMQKFLVYKNIRNPCFLWIIFFLPFLFGSAGVKPRSFVHARQALYHQVTCYAKTVPLSHILTPFLKWRTFYNWESCLAFQLYGRLWVASFLKCTARLC